MRVRVFLISSLAVLWMLSCKHSKSLQDQLTDSFANHLKRLDSSATLDSVHILWNAQMTQKMGRVIDDSIYRREFIRVQAQLSRSQLSKDQDSIDFYQYEIDYMEKEIDSVTKSIAQADTTRHFGNLIGASFFITKNQKTKMDSTIVFIDSTSTMRYTDLMDSALRRTVKTWN